MAASCLRPPSGCASCSSSPLAAPTAALLPSCSSTSLSSVSFLCGGRNGVRSLAARGAASISSSGSARRRLPSFCVRAGIRAVETYDASFQLQPQADETLRDLLSSKVFCAQVAEQSLQGVDVRYDFTGELFQPVPWSPTTKFGMPVEFERYLQDKENFTIINVPPNFMFKAKIFKPSRLCAVFKRV